MGSYDIVVTSRTKSGTTTKHHFKALAQYPADGRIVLDDVTSAMTVESVDISGRRYRLQFSRGLTEFIRECLRDGTSGRVPERK